MATRVQALCAFIDERYDGDGGRVWTEATSGADLKQRLGELPGIGDMKVRSLIATLVKQFGVRPDGYEEVLPNHPTLGDVDSAEALAELPGRQTRGQGGQAGSRLVIIERSMHPGWLSNSYLVGDAAGGTGVVIDSGGPIAPLIDAAESHDLTSHTF